MLLNLWEVHGSSHLVVAVASVEPIWPWVEGPAEAARVQAHADRVAAIAREFGIFLSVGPTPLLYIGQIPLPPPVVLTFCMKP